jgi:hypothetical protein
MTNMDELKHPSEEPFAALALPAHKKLMVGRGSS